jgi:hypothetical protein
MILRNTRVTVIASILFGIHALCSIPSLCTEKAKSHFSITLDLPKEIHVDGEILKPGSYIADVRSSKLRLKSQGKVVVKLAVQWKEGPRTPDHNIIVLRNGTISEFHFAGQGRFLRVLYNFKDVSGVPVQPTCTTCFQLETPFFQALLQPMRTPPMSMK